MMVQVTMMMSTTMQGFLYPPESWSRTSCGFAPYAVFKTTPDLPGVCATHGVSHIGSKTDVDGFNEQAMYDIHRRI